MPQPLLLPYEKLSVRQKYVKVELSLSFGEQLWDYMSQFS